MAKRIFIYILLGTAAFIAAFWYIQKHVSPPTVDTLPQNLHSLPSKAIPNSDNASFSPTSYILPATILLPVPFTPQAPTANWDKLHNEACEEASAIMAAEFFSGNKTAQLDPKVVEEQIAALTKWQDQTFGYHLDITTEETARMMRDVYGLNTKIVSLDEQAIKQELAQNHLVIISFNGQLLKNPNYKHPGPIHHMMVLKGYDSQGIITNDPGTKHGLNYAYDFQTLYNAAADWSHDMQSTDTNIKTAIVVWK